MNNCKVCDKQIDDHRYHLGYTECLDCSEVEKYSAHQVYPHKTGGYVQPVSSSKKKHLDSIDRRSRGGNIKMAKGIMKDNSWDRWLDKYYHNLYNPKPKSKPIKRAHKPLPKMYTFNDMIDSVIENYNNHGYDNTKQYCFTLFKNNKISLITKSQLMNKINSIQILPKRLRKKIILDFLNISL
tara:strand:- start:744 stop:1292 length:549 start_codon:yes stop_codon:yes gene_type:complete